VGSFIKHYEKIILAAFLLIFISALIYLIMVFSKSTEINEDDLTLIRRSADYNSKFDELGNESVKKDKDKKYAFLKQLDTQQVWTKTINKNTNSPVSTDLMDPIPAARCPKCKKIIPLIYFKNNDKCILCGAELHPTKKIKVDAGTEDKDGDLIPDMWESLHKMNPDSADDKMKDKDDDAYANYIEYSADPQTNPDDSTSHPPLAWRLSLRGVKQTKIPLLLFNVMKNNSEDKTKWLVQIKIKDRRKRWKSVFVKLDADIKLGKNLYKIKDIIFEEKEKYNPKLKQPMRMNVSRIIIQNTVNDSDTPITVHMKQNVYENLVKIRLTDFFNEKRYTVKEGDTLVAGDDIVGREKYKIIARDGKKSVTIKDVSNDKKDGKEFIIRKKSILKQKVEGITKLDESKEDGDINKMQMREGDGMGNPLNPVRMRRGSRSRLAPPR